MAYPLNRPGIRGRVRAPRNKVPCIRRDRNTRHNKTRLIYNTHEKGSQRPATVAPTPLTSPERDTRLCVSVTNKIKSRGRFVGSFSDRPRKKDTPGRRSEYVSSVELIQRSGRRGVRTRAAGTLDGSRSRRSGDYSFVASNGTGDTRPENGREKKRYRM